MASSSMDRLIRQQIERCRQTTIRTSAEMSDEEVAAVRAEVGERLAGRRSMPSPDAGAREHSTPRRPPTASDFFRAAIATALERGQGPTIFFAGNPARLHLRDRDEGER